jgi:hypothetical protein
MVPSAAAVVVETIMLAAAAVAVVVTATLVVVVAGHRWMTMTIFRSDQAVLINFVAGRCRCSVAPYAL